MRIVVVLVFFLVGCGGSRAARSPDGAQTYEEAIAAICEVDQRAGLSAEDDPITVEERRVEWTMQHVEHPDGIELYTFLRVDPPDAAADRLSRAAEDAGLGKCPLADTLRVEEEE